MEQLDNENLITQPEENESEKTEALSEFETEKEKPRKKKRSKFKIVFNSVLVAIAVTVFAFLINFKVTYEARIVEGWSMLPTLNFATESEKELGDTVYVNKRAKIKQGDIIVLFSNELKESIIKRCIALGGQTVNIVGETKIGTCDFGTKEDVIKISVYEKYYIVVDGEILKEDYIIEAGSPKVLEQDFQRFCFWKHKQGVKTQDIEKEITLKEDEVFALGDNRKNSIDSSSIGPFNKSEVIGRVDFIIYKNTSFIKECLQKIMIIFIIKK